MNNPTKNKLNSKQRLFTIEYLKDRNATSAAIRAGYSKKTASSQASRLLTNVKVQEIINKQTEVISKEALISSTYVLLQLKEIVEVCMQRKPVNSKFGKFNAVGANRALELIGRHLGLFKESNISSSSRNIAERLRSARLRISNQI